MPIIHIDGLGSKGINRDIEPAHLEPEYWSDGKNVRFLNQRVQKFLGTEEVYESWNLGAGYTCPQWLLPWDDVGTPYWFAPGTAKIIRMENGSTVDVTRTSGGNYNAATTNLWSGMVLGGVPILNNDASLDYPQSWVAGTSKFQDLPNWPANTYCAIMRSLKQYAVALDITVSGARSPHVVKWSNPALPGSVPTKWDNADDNDSNEQPLSEGGGFIIDAQALRDFLVVYKETATYLMSVTSGPFVMNFRRIFDQSGILAPRCAKNFFGKHFVVTRGDVIVHDGQTAISVIDKKNRNWLFNNMKADKLRQTYVAPNYPNNEMWICFISNSIDGTFADSALVWNWVDNTWGVRELADVAHIGYGLVDKTGASDIIDDQDVIIDLVEDYIDGAPFAAGQLRLLGAANSATNDKLLEFDETNTEYGTNIDCYVERTGLAIVGRDRQGRPIIDPTSTKYIRRVWPKLESTGPVDIYIGSQSRLEGPTTWAGPYSFDPEVDSHIDCRVQGRTVGLKIASNADISWSCTGFALDLEIIGGSVR
jgi:hypothetical protein